MTWTANVWAHTLQIGGNSVRQLLVPKAELSILEDNGKVVAANQFGIWPCSSGMDYGAGVHLAIRRTGLTTKGRAEWAGSREMDSPEVVTASHRGALGFRNHLESNSLRRPQIGALHSIIGYWSSGLDRPAIIVMPTGTGKTETMIALLVAERPERTLVIVPTAALRTQLADKFQTLGILQDLEIVSPAAKRPCVARLEKGIASVEQADQIVSACNVMVTTPDALKACSPEARTKLLESFSHLIVDEAHHAPAPSWMELIEEFKHKRVVLFTATPFREDKRSLPGKVIYRFPLREAQKDGYFTKIDYKSILSLEGTDEKLAREAIDRLTSDLQEGFDHLLMARVSSISRAEEILKLYERLAPHYAPQLIHSKLKDSTKKSRIQSIIDRETKIVVCVDMLGEGFDLPALKVAAIHDPKKSLSPTIQFIGRFTRVSGSQKLGGASVFVPRQPTKLSSPLRDLLAEDADWNLLLKDISDAVTESAEKTSEFEASFADGPEEVSVSSLMPKMSAVAHVAPVDFSWDPARAVGFYGPERVLGGTTSVGSDGRIAWLVVTHSTSVRWGRAESLEEISHELIVMYFDEKRRVLYLHSSNNSSHFSDLAAEVLGGEAQLISDEQTYRVFAGLKRLVPTNIGLFDVVNHFRRFSMHVGSDVLEALSSAETKSKSMTHIATSGFDQGQRASISAAQSGRIWSPRTASSLNEWVLWCDQQGSKLLDDRIDLDEVLSSFVIPQDLNSRPPFVLLAVEWPWPIYLQTTQRQIAHNGHDFDLADAELVVDAYGDTGPFLFSIVTPKWRIPYSADFEGSRLVYSPIGEDATLRTSQGEIRLQDWLVGHPLTLLLEGDRVITNRDRLYAPRIDVEPYSADSLKIVNWAGVDLKVESQGANRRADSIQAFTSKLLQSSTTFDVLIDDDGSGEAADLVGLSVVDSELIVTLVHCKYSSESTSGGRVKDLYEVCGQAMRSAKWRQNGVEPLLHHLDRRSQNRFKKSGRDSYEVGDIEELYRIRELARQLSPRFRILIVQPGLSAKLVSPEQLQLLAGAEAYIKTVTAGSMEVFCNS
jgi:superfamily II DNA or RNA helicase